MSEFGTLNAVDVGNIMDPEGDAGLFNELQHNEYALAEQRSRRPEMAKESREFCEECEQRISTARREGIKGVRDCIQCARKAQGEV